MYTICKDFHLWYLAFLSVFSFRSDSDSWTHVQNVSALIMTLLHIKKLSLIPNSVFSPSSVPQFICHEEIPRIHRVKRCRLLLRSFAVIKEMRFYALRSRGSSSSQTIFLSNIQPKSTRTHLK